MNQSHGEIFSIFNRLDLQIMTMKVILLFYFYFSIELATHFGFCGILEINTFETKFEVKLQKIGNSDFCVFAVRLIHPALISWHASTVHNHGSN